MPINSQKRIRLSDAVQQSAAESIASLVSQQFADAIYDASFTMLVDIDRSQVDATDGDITVTIPAAADLVVGKPYLIEKLGADNEVTVTFASGDTYLGDATVVLAGDGDMIGFIVDPTGLLKPAFPPPLAATVPAGALAIAENLGDLDDVVEARTNLSINKVYLPLRVATLVGSNVYRVLSPYAGTVTSIRTVTEGVLTTGDATLTGKIGGVAITDGVVTITQVGSAAGDKDTATPSAANTVAAWDEISLTVGGTNATATVANCWIEITRS